MENPIEPRPIAESGAVAHAFVKENPSVPPTPSHFQTPTPVSTQPQTAGRLRKGWIGLGLVFAMIGVAASWVYPSVLTALNTVSTDDAYVNGHVTNVAPRVAGQVARVLVDDNMRVRKGELLVVLDKEPYQVQVNIKKAILEVKKADLLQAQAKVRSLEATGRSRRWQLESRHGAG